MKHNIYKVEIDNAKCTGCKLCQMVCSYHQTGFFTLERSCIRISIDNGTGSIQTTIDPECCDMCPEDDLPLCMKFCPPRAISITRIQQD